MRNTPSRIVGVKTISMLIFSVLALAAFSLGADLRIEVLARSANVRLSPALDSPVVGKASMGLVLTAKKKTGEWYLVELPPDANGVAVRGYLHESVVKEISAEAPAPKAGIEPKPAPARPAVKPPASKKAPARVSGARKKLYVRLGAGYATKSFDYENSWSFPMYGESGNASEKYAVAASGVAFDAGFGFMITPSLGVELSLTPASGKSKGAFAASFPHPFYFDLPREKAWTNDGLKYSAFELDLDLLYSFPMTRRIGLYVCAGGTYFMGVKVESLKSLDWAESGYPYFDLNVTPQYASYSAGAFGFNAGAGVDYRLSEAMAINLNARYSSGSAKIKIEGNTVTIPAGGIRATAGIKFAF
jgi:opacity protein-like surface antigen